MIEFVKRQARDPCVFEPAVFAIYTLLFSKVLFLFADYRRACHNAAADKQQCDPQHKVAAIAGLRRLRIVRKLSRYGSCLGDFPCCRSVGKILTAILAVPEFNITLGILGHRLCVNM